MRTLAKSMLAGMVAASAVAVAASASADIVCNSDNQCWHSKVFVPRPEFGVVVHPNSWAWGPNDHYTWKEPPSGAGYGYWRNNVWVKF